MYNNIININLNNNSRHKVNPGRENIFKVVASKQNTIYASKDGRVIFKGRVDEKSLTLKPSK